MRKARVFAGLVMLALAVPAAPPLAGQAEQESPANVSKGFHLAVKQGQVTAFEAGLIKHEEWHAAQNDPWRWDVWQLVVGERMGRYVIISSGHRWEDFDSYSLPGDAADWDKTGGPHVEQMDTWIDLMSLRGSRPLESPPVEGTFARVANYRIKPGKDGDFWNVIHRFTELANQANWEQRYAILSYEVGQAPNLVTEVFFTTGWAGLGGLRQSEWEMLVAAVGEEGAGELVASFWGAVESSDRTFWRYRADLSYVPEGM